ncbi:hypothetical protein OVY01_13510 [Robbsia sp. Bb-Pol-6]|uniref:Uncharacterized protein n=1 Tax=Robbsia betulipollinis TaxID=2981849 RepID=A0ABT3ZNW5_9BURK|nr:hypothetical protein [Robbsia betulipollinis]MCY0388236.1 hypothetical protein [Robbsia betulipollinis]
MGDNSTTRPKPDRAWIAIDGELAYAKKDRHGGVTGSLVTVGADGKEHRIHLYAKDGPMGRKLRFLPSDQHVRIVGRFMISDFVDKAGVVRKSHKIVVDSISVLDLQEKA